MEERDDYTQIYLCAACGHPMSGRLPSGLKGDFVHSGCHTQGRKPRRKEAK
jgi:hypothetical protein